MYNASLQIIKKKRFLVEIKHVYEMHAWINEATG